MNYNTFSFLYAIAKSQSTSTLCVNTLNYSSVVVNALNCFHIKHLKMHSFISGHLGAAGQANSCLFALQAHTD